LGFKYSKELLIIEASTVVGLALGLCQGSVKCVFAIISGRIASFAFALKHHLCRVDRPFDGAFWEIRQSEKNVASEI
jgi:hypothetical protein